MSLCLITTGEYVQKHSQRIEKEITEKHIFKVNYARKQKNTKTPAKYNNRLTSMKYKTANF